MSLASEATIFNISLSRTSVLGHEYAIRLYGFSQEVLTLTIRVLARMNPRIGLYPHRNTIHKRHHLTNSVAFSDGAHAYG